LPAHIARSHRRMLSPKNHIRGKCRYNTTDASVDQAAVQPNNQTNKKAGVEPAFSVLVG
jgi:hypothetical protein